jgi:serine/threonine protein kinase
MTRHRTADLDPTSFGGRYTLLRRLAIGGMAEIYLAKQAAMAGFEKEVVIKRLRAELADDPRIVEMFLDEARIGALLNHPNIVHVYDVDVHDGIPYIAMEYIVGEELNELCRRGITHKKFLPLEHAVELIRQAAAGMGYFHAKRGSEGTDLADQPLEIVHLDISPSNLLVTQDGFLKVIDFGIANARGQRQRSDVIPGKLGYMSPEQAGRKAVDHRSDIFSLGIVLYEITVGKRLFRGAASEVVQRLVEAEVQPPTFVRRNFPTALESIVMRTLEKHAHDRYQSAYDLADDLETFLRDQRMHSGPVRIARYLDTLTQAAGGPRRPELVSEAETRGAPSGDLDFDSQVFDSYAPAKAPEWEDADQPEADVAAALGLELAELRALRTPVPVIPAGMSPVSGRGLTGEPVGDTSPLTRVDLIEETPAPKKRAITDEGDGDGEVDVPIEEDLPTVDQPPQLPLPAPRPSAPPVMPAPVRSSLGRPQFAPHLARRAAEPGLVQRLPWIMVGALVVAVLALVAYIVLT